MVDPDRDREIAENEGRSNEGNNGNWFKDAYNVGGYIQVAVVVLLLALWILLGMP